MTPDFADTHVPHFFEGYERSTRPSQSPGIHTELVTGRVGGKRVHLFLRPSLPTEANRETRMAYRSLVNGAGSRTCLKRFGPACSACAY